jgi:nucleoside-diphosphate-sugar epimerase
MMSSALNIITGATGLLGSHIAERLVNRGERVRALVRPSSDATFLKNLGVDLVSGDLNDPQSIRQAVSGAAIVYHCAARVGDWGPWQQYQAETVTATHNLVEACQAEKIGRLLHVSSISVYGIVNGTKTPLGEDAPLGQNLWLWDNYARSKILAEEEAHKFPEHTIVRPSWIYGPRDRNTISRVVPALRTGKVPIIGSGENYLNVIYAGDVAEGAIRAAQHADARGQVYNLCSDGEVTQRDLIDTLTDSLLLPRIQKHVPYYLANKVAFVHECMARLLRRKKPPRITRRAIYLIGRPTLFSSAKARSQLGWFPQVTIQEGVKRSMEWYVAQEKKR